ncbi:Uncharacterised protein [uncultured archaeon]|nr:Uncharacterised protein [uncultured archaeon]
MQRAVKSPFSLIKRIQKNRAQTRIFSLNKEKGTVEDVHITLKKPVTKLHLVNMAQAFSNHLGKLLNLRPFFLDKRKDDEVIVVGSPSGTMSFKIHPDNPNIIHVHGTYSPSKSVQYHLSKFLEEHVSEDLRKQTKWWHKK